MGIDASLFGHNAAYWYTIPRPCRPASVHGRGGRVSGSGVRGPSWGGYPNWEALHPGHHPGPPADRRRAAGVVDLDNVYPVVVGDQVVLQDGDCVCPTTVSAVQVLTRSGYLMSAKLTSITLDPPPNRPGRLRPAHHPGAGADRPAARRGRAASTTRSRPGR